MVQTNKTKNHLHDLGYKIFLDRYAQKDMTRETLAVGDTVIVVVNPKTGQREIGKVTELDLPTVTIQLLDGETVTRDLEHVDKPIEVDPAQMMDRVARGIAEVEKNKKKRKEWADNFRWLLEDWKFVPGGRILTGAGTDQKLTYYNCYVIPSPKDSRHGIIETLGQMTEIMSRGGGVGINLSTLRPRQAYVKGVNGRSSGSVSWGALYSFVTGLIEQGGSRRGALMLILNDWHPDLSDFINSKRQAGNITNANISVGISDSFMDAVKNDGDWQLRFPDTGHKDYDTIWDGDLEKWEAEGYPVIPYKTVKARDLWNEIIDSAWASAEPGVWFRERSNKMSNSWYFNPLISTNPCFTGDTRIYTSKGMIRADELFNDETEFEAVIDGRFGLNHATTPSTRVFMTGIKPVFKVETEEGYTVRTTADHRFMTPSGWVELQDLQAGDTLHILNRKGGFGQEGSHRLGAILGWLIGDGTIKADRATLSFFGDEKRELAPLFAEYMNEIVEPLTNHARAYTVGVVDIATRDEARVSSARLRTLVETYGLVENKFQVPEVVFKGTEDMQRGFLQALFTADGGVQQTSSNATVIRLASSHLHLLEQVQILLSNFGIACRIFKNRRTEQYRDMPDGNGGSKSYLTQAQHEIHIGKTNILTFQDEIGFLTSEKNTKLATKIADYIKGPRQEHFTIKIKSITEDGIEPVYDVTVPVTHSITINGIITHQCGEQPLSGFSVCNLGAINLAKFYDAEKHDVAWDDLGRTVEYAVRFLDNVIDNTPYFFEENALVQGNERRVGLGTMGIAELMISLKIRYGSDESIQFIDDLYKFIAVRSYEASSDNAKEKGAFPKFDADKLLQSGFMLGMPDDVRERIRKNGLRNVTLLTQAPTGTTGTMVNTSTGIEPFFSWVYYRKSRLGLHEEKVPIVQEWLDANPDQTDQDLPDYFVTAMDLAPRDHIRVQGAFQRWIDSAISKTANLPNNYTVEQTRELYEYLYDLGCKGGTIYRDGSRDEQVLMLKGDERAESEAKANEKSTEAPAEKVTQVATPHRAYPRPEKLQGVTAYCPTPFGTAYVTMNSDEHGNPFEVFITAPGKAGSDLQADAEGLGRMISLSLRTTDPHNRREMIRLIIEQLRDIGGSRSIGFGANRVISLPDSVARALEEHYFPQAHAEQLGLPLIEQEPIKFVPSSPAKPEHNSTHNGHANGIYNGADVCPSCGTISLVRVEGCRKCLTCGYSEC